MVVLQQNLDLALNLDVAQIYPKNLADIFNESIKMGKFSDILQKAEVPPVCKKNDMNDKLNDNFLSN